MKRKGIYRSFIAMIGVFSLVVLTSGHTFSWFEDENKVIFSSEMGTTQANYYESGDGSKEKPFIISNGRHLYNLAWLQYLGTYNETKDDDGKLKQFYFELKKDIDMSGYVLPPIGTVTNPFISNFDAKNHTVSNLTISNVIEDGYIKNYPSVVKADDFNGLSAIVGFFGVIGSYNKVPSVSYDSSVNEVKNLYLDNVTIKTKKDNLLVGIFAGYVNGTIDNCGVHYAKFDINGKTTKISDFNNVSEFTLIGSYNRTNYKWDADPDSGGDVGYGTSTDIKALHESLIDNNLKDDTTGFLSSNIAIPFKFKNTTLKSFPSADTSITVYENYGTKKINITASSYKTFEASDSGNNLGYYSGQVKTYAKSLSFDVNEFGTTESNLKTPPDDVLEYLQNNNTHLLRLNSGTNSDDVRYLFQSNVSYIENARVGNWKGNLIIPPNGIWVAPKENGKFKFVFYNDGYSNGKSVGILFMKLKRIEPGNYSSPFDANYSVGSGLYYSCKYGYFEYDAKTEYEYFVTYYKQDSNATAPYIAYMDIGVNGGDTPSDTRLSLADFDFVTKETDGSLTKIKNYDSSTKTYTTSSSYSKSNVTFAIGDTSNDKTALAFRRLSEASGGVLYYSSPSVLTPSSTGTKNEASDDDCNSKK